MMNTRDAASRPTILLRMDDAARRLGCSRPMLYKLMNAGHLPYTRVGGDRRIAEGAIEAYIARNMVGGTVENGELLTPPRKRARAQA